MCRWRRSYSAGREPARDLRPSLPQGGCSHEQPEMRASHDLRADLRLLAADEMSGGEQLFGSDDLVVAGPRAGKSGLAPSRDRSGVRALRNGRLQADCLYRAVARPQDNRCRGDRWGACTIRESARSAASCAAYHSEAAAGRQLLRVRADVSTAAAHDFIYQGPRSVWLL